MPGPFDPNRWLCRLGEVLEVLETKFTESEMTTIRVLLMRHFRQRYDQNPPKPVDEIPDAAPSSPVDHTVLGRSDTPWEALKDELPTEDPDEG